MILARYFVITIRGIAFLLYFKPSLEAQYRIQNIVQEPKIALVLFQSLSISNFLIHMG